LQWIQDLKRNNVDNLNNVRHEASRHLKNKRELILKLKLRNLKLIIR